MKRIYFTLIFTFLGLLCFQSVRADQTVSTTVSDICKNYGSSYLIGLEGMSYEPYIVNITRGDTPDEVFIYGLYFEDIEIRATLDPVTSELILSAQDLYYNQSQKVMISLYFVELSEEEPTFVDSISARISEDGKIIFPENVNILIGNDGAGYYWGGYRLSLTPFFEYKAEEWTPAGTGLFKDGWITPYFGEDIYLSFPEYEVEVLRNVNNPLEFLIVNPYNNETFEQYLEEKLGGEVTDGFIRFQIEDPMFVTVDPLVKSGASLNLSFLGEPYNYKQDIYDFNIEGFLAFSGDPKEEIYEYLDSEDLPVSNYDEDEHIVTFFNCRFGLSEQPLYGNYWNISSWENPNALLYSSLEFDAYASIENVETENGFDEIRYFNLQGLELKNPAKGQIVIKRQGSKSSKILFR